MKCSKLHVVQFYVIKLHLQPVFLLRIIKIQIENVVVYKIEKYV